MFRRVNAVFEGLLMKAKPRDIGFAKSEDRSVASNPPSLELEHDPLLLR